LANEAGGNFALLLAKQHLNDILYLCYGLANNGKKHIYLTGPFNGGSLTDGKT
jgi:hypothetical protein